MSSAMSQTMRKSDYFKSTTLQQMVSMVANISMQNLKEWEEDLSEQTISKNDEGS